MLLLTVLNLSAVGSVVLVSSAFNRTVLWSNGMVSLNWRGAL